MKTSSKQRDDGVIIWLLAVGVLGFGGCHHFGARQHACTDFACGAVPAPAGTYRDQWHAEQTARADRDFFMFYLYEWQGDSDQLSSFGQRHLHRAVDRAAQTPHPFVIEPSGDRELDQRRVQAMQLALVEHDPAFGHFPIVVGFSDAEPLYGFESQRVIRGYMGGMGGGMGGMGGGMNGGMGGGMGGMGGGMF